MNVAYYLKSPQYSLPGYAARRHDNGATMESHYGGIAACPVCGFPCSVAQEQIEHTSDPHSVIHTAKVPDAQGNMRPCGGHWVYQDPEEPATRADLPKPTLDFIGEDFQNWPVFKRPFRWA